MGMRAITKAATALALGLGIAAMALAQTPNPAETGELRFPGEQFDRVTYAPTQATGNRVYEAILMDMRDANFEPLSAYDPADDVRQMAEPVGLLKVLMKSNDYITCTASIIDANLILTNWHCLPKFGSQVSRAALQMGYYSADGRGVQVYAVGVAPVESDQALDYAILRVTGDLSKWGRAPLSTQDPPPNRSLEIIHHPAGQPKQVTRRSCRSNDPAIVQGELQHKCDTLAGSSGAPVFFGGKVAALHFAGVPQSRLGIDPSFEANLAIPISRIAQKSAVVKRLTTVAAPAPAPATPTAVIPGKDAPASATRDLSGGVARGGVDPGPSVAPLPAAGMTAGRVAGSIIRDRLKDGSQGPEMVILPRGSFLMGSPENEPGRGSDEGPQRRVTIGYDLAVGKYEVTWAEYLRCVVCRQAVGDPWGKGARPVTYVSRDDANGYAHWLSERTGETYRLLTEAEWEYAARAGSSARWSSGSMESQLASYAWFGANAGGKTQPVGGKAANAFGLHDMFGNVWEWVEDCYQDSYSAGQPSDGRPLTNCSQDSLRVVRGGAFYSTAEGLRSADRFSESPGTRDTVLGFRLAKVISQ
jgi:formylglycine-generating enzyme required for sulfatase activity